MKQSRLFSLAIIVLTVFCVTSCISEDLEGKWDPIQTDRKYSDIYFNIAGGCDTIRLQNHESWDLISVTERIIDYESGEGRMIYRDPDKNEDVRARNVIIGEWYSVRIPEENRKLLIVECSKNDTHFSRELVIYIVAGDAYEMVYTRQYENYFN